MNRAVMDVRPPATLQAVITLGIALLWWVGIDQSIRHFDVPQDDMTTLKRMALYGPLLIVVLSAAFYGWIWVIDYRIQKDIEAKLASVQNKKPSSPRQAMLEGAGPRYALEIRALGVAVHDYWQDGLWKGIEEDKLTGRSIFAHGTTDKPRSAYDRSFNLRIASEATFEYVGKDAVTDWPVPTFAAEPPRHADEKTSAGGRIGSRARSAGFAYTYFLWEDDINAEDTSPLIDKLFAFFDANPQVPEALIMVRDADEVRRMLGPIGAPRPQGPLKPTIFTSVVTLLVSRTDRVDKYIRPYARAESKQAVNADQTDHDYIKQYLFYNKASREFGTLKSTDSFPRSMTPSSTYWSEQLPRLLESVADRGDKRPDKSAYLPLRWMTWQIKTFDRAPLMGYLHRPVTTRLRDEHDEPLKGEARLEALRQGWQTALASLPEGSLPQRVFHDRADDGGLRRELATVLKEQPTPIDLNDIDQGFDIGVRIGNTGVASPFVQIALATIAGYKKGGAAATVHRRSGGDVTFTMVSPPDAESKATWEGEAKRNPFMAHVPH